MGAFKAKRLILIVEDSSDLQVLLRQMLERQGYMVVCADNGQAALDTLRAAAALPGVILLDLMMPVMDGIEFRRQQMLDPRLAQVPVVIMTADANPLPKAQQVSAVALVRKPIRDIADLFSVVDRCGVWP